MTKHSCRIQSTPSYPRDMWEAVSGIRVNISWVMSFVSCWKYTIGLEGGGGKINITRDRYLFGVWVSFTSGKNQRKIHSSALRLVGGRMLNRFLVCHNHVFIVTTWGGCDGAWSWTCGSKHLYYWFIPLPVARLGQGLLWEVLFINIINSCIMYSILCYQHSERIIY